tara:strand:+ start:1469 stop:2014 length:546 start_codon:yes stop_codon:yes gene_type:complete
MGTNLHDVYYCQLDRNKVLSDRMYKRNIPSVQMGASYFSRPVDTYATVFGMVDNHKQATVKKANFSPYSQKYVFNPGSSAPYDGYSRNVDTESILNNSFHPLQKCVQSKYIPGTNSDMFNSSYLVPTTKPVEMTNNLLFKEETFYSFNPNGCNLGHKLFHNHIRQQTKDIEPQRVGSLKKK